MAQYPQDPVGDDASGGWNAVASQLIEHRNPRIGVATVLEWIATLPNGASILDLGCGHGTPISAVLVERGFRVYGVDASPDLVAEFQRRLPGVHVRCEAVQTSTFFERRFDAAIAVGLIFLLPELDQCQLICRVSDALHAGGRFLFSAPSQAVSWADILTGRQSRSLGIDAYKALLLDAGLELVGQYTDEGENHYYSTKKAVHTAA